MCAWHTAPWCPMSGVGCLVADRSVSQTCESASDWSQGGRWVVLPVAKWFFFSMHPAYGNVAPCFSCFVFGVHSISVFDSGLLLRRQSRPVPCQHKQCCVVQLCFHVEFRFGKCGLLAWWASKCWKSAAGGLRSSAALQVVVWRAPGPCMQGTSVAGVAGFIIFFLL